MFCCCTGCPSCGNAKFSCRGNSLFGKAYLLNCCHARGRWLPHMFKLVCNTGVWDTLYVSTHASSALRSYLPPHPEREYNDGPFQTQHLAIDRDEKRSRDRLVILV